MAGHMYNGRETELLIPASSLEVLKIAVIFGADAVYIGGEAFGLRAKAKNFSIEDMKEGVKFAHERNVKVYVTANILAHNYDLEGARAYFEELKEVGPDALIISDPGMFTIAKEVLPDTDIHISTQANNTNYMTYNFWWNQGAKRVVSARELSLEEIKEIRAHIPEEMEIETFMHGAMCISYSGRCLLSSFLAGRDANRGACTHPCRWKYAVVEENRPGQYMPVYENERGTYIFNSKDLCMIEHIPEMVSSGIDSFKIEGRMKTALYVATVARTYRLAIDDFGTGYSNYGYMRDKIFDIVKVDRSFITDIDKQRNNYLMVSFIIKMAHEMGLHVCIEGVETKEELACVRELGADYIQGYYYGKPVCVADFEEQHLKKLILG